MATPTRPDPAGVVGDAFHFSTLGLPTTHTGPEHASIWWYRDDVEVDFGAGVSVEARVRVIESEYSVGGTTERLRPGFAIVVHDRLGRKIWIGLGSNKVFLSNTVLSAPGTPGTVETSFDTTDNFHVYRIDVSAAGATLSIDGAAVLSLDEHHPAEDPFDYNTVYFGDTTSWANSEVNVAWIRFTGDAPPCCPADLNRDGFVDFPDYLEFLNLFDAGC